MQSGKSPGWDGFTTDFHKKFWPIIGDTLVEMLNCSADKGELSQSQRNSIKTLLQKRPKDQSGFVKG